MSEDNPTAELTDSEMLRALMRDMREVKDRLDKLEAQGESGIKTTRPLLDQLIKEMVGTRETLSAKIEGVEKEVRSMNRKLDALNKDMLTMKGDLQGFDERLTKVEQHPN